MDEMDSFLAVDHIAYKHSTGRLAEVERKRPIVEAVCEVSLYLSSQESYNALSYRLADVATRAHVSTYLTIYSTYH